MYYIKSIYPQLHKIVNVCYLLTICKQNIWISKQKQKVSNSKLFHMVSLCQLILLRNHCKGNKRKSIEFIERQHDLFCGPWFWALNAHIATITRFYSKNQTYIKNMCMKWSEYVYSLTCNIYIVSFDDHYSRYLVYPYPLFETNKSNNNLNSHNISNMI